MRFKRSFIPITLFFILGAGIICTLLVWHAMGQPVLNGFNRLLKPGAVLESGRFSLGLNSYYLAGISDEAIYLGNYVGTTFLLKINPDFRDTASISIQLPSKAELVVPVIKVRVDSPKVYLFEGRSAKILYTTLPTTEAASIEASDNIYFADGIALSSTSFILKVFDNRLKQFVLTKKIPGIEYNTYASHVLKKRGDGYFSLDGQILCQKEAARVIYLYHYRNEFTVMDTALNVVYEGSTIDTVRSPQVKVAVLNDGRRITMSAPQVMVNRYGCVNSRWLFVNSGLKADNEDQRRFADSSVIDVYRLSDGQYQFSFYLSKPQSAKLSSIIATDAMLVASFGEIVCKYDLNF